MWALALMKLCQMQKAKYNYNLLNLIIIEHKRRNKSTEERMLLAENINFMLNPPAYLVSTLILN